MTAVHPDQAAFLRAIRDVPGDDTPRLAFADWLDEHDEPGRAEFLRFQVELANHPGVNCGQMYCSTRSPEGLCDDCRRFKWLRKRERELLTPANVGAWLGELPGLDVMTGVRDLGTGETHHGGWSNHPRVVLITADFARGFVAAVRCPLAAWVGGPCECVREWELVRNPVVWPGGGCERGCVDGRTKGIAALVCGAHPVTAVRLVGKEPQQIIDPPGKDFFTWFEGNVLSETSPHHLPSDLFRLLDRRTHATPELAHAALSAAATTYGRKVAGLPAL